jgi:hypothetical protein
MSCISKPKFGFLCAYLKKCILFLLLLLVRKLSGSTFKMYLQIYYVTSNVNCHFRFLSYPEDSERGSFIPLHTGRIRTAIMVSQLEKKSSADT